MNTIASALFSRRAQCVALMTVVLAGCATPTPAPVSDRGGAPAQEARPGYYIVRPGDTLMGVSRRFNVTVPDLASWNRLTDPNQIEVGQELRVAPPAGSAGVVVQPVAPSGVVVSPVGPGSPAASSGVRRSPQGGKEPYSEQALANANAQPTPAPAPAPVAPPVDDAPRPGANGWIWPANGKVVATFSDSNKGIDIAGKLGEPVVAADSGKVVYAGSGLRGYGKLVIIKHDADFLTAYAHNRELLVKEGDTVNKGQKIAELGDTDSDKPQLHFEVRRQGKPVDPTKYLPTR